MRSAALTITFLLVTIMASGQNNEKTSAIVAEGKYLYRLEMASWHGTDIFLEKFKNQREKIGGYFSYGNKDATTCLFFSNDATPKVLATILFDSTYNVSTAKIDDRQRELSPDENEIYIIREKALEAINKDTLFRSYENMNLNLIPLVNGKEKKVYVLTGPKEHGIVVFGNDYLLNFNDANNLVSKAQLHKNIITIKGRTDEKNVVGTMHTHLPETGDYITATDICTLMLYAKFSTWKQHIVVSENYVSIWDCEKNTLLAMTKEAWEKINKNQKK